MFHSKIPFFRLEETPYPLYITELFYLIFSMYVVMVIYVPYSIIHQHTIIEQGMFSPQGDSSIIQGMKAFETSCPTWRTSQWSQPSIIWPQKAPTPAWWVWEVWPGPPSAASPQARDNLPAAYSGFTALPLKPNPTLSHLLSLSLSPSHSVSLSIYLSFLLFLSIFFLWVCRGS